MRLVLVLFALCVSFQADANPNLIGTWCQKFDDFTEVLIIKDTLDVEIFTAGNSSGEVHGRMTGYLSLGATNQFLSIRGAELPIYDIRVRGLFKNRLTIEYAEGDKELYKKCQVMIAAVK